MNDKPERDPQQKKRAYMKPELKQVPLRPDEAVLGNCKTSNTVGPVQGTCSVVGGCFTLGS